jgi:hypothetical protein
LRRANDKGAARAFSEHSAFLRNISVPKTTAAIVVTYGTFVVGGEGEIDYLIGHLQRCYNMSSDHKQQSGLGV